MRQSFGFALVLSALIAVLPLRQAAAQQGVIRVFAAASLAESLQELAGAYEQSSGSVVRISFASSGTLARQIEAGAPADIFVSADTEWMDELATRDLLVAGSRRTLLTNVLVLVAPAASPLTLRLASGAPVAAALDGGRLAVADPDHVPAGRYARAAFQTLGIWQDLEAHLVRGEDVRATLLWVARGEAPLGVVYGTDARAEPRVRVVATFPPGSHPPIVYPIALLKGAAPDAKGFVDFLESPAARAAFDRYGFGQP